MAYVVERPVLSAGQDLVVLAPLSAVFSTTDANKVLAGEYIQSPLAIPINAVNQGLAIQCGTSSINWSSSVAFTRAAWDTSRAQGETTRASGTLSLELLIDPVVTISDLLPYLDIEHYSGKPYCVVHRSGVPHTAAAVPGQPSFISVAVCGPNSYHFSEIDTSGNNSYRLTATLETYMAWPLQAIFT